MPYIFPKNDSGELKDVPLKYQVEKKMAENYQNSAEYQRKS